jgi:hypothetical protein
MSYSTRDQERIHRMATTAGIADLYDFAKSAMGDGSWENFNRSQAREFEAAIAAHGKPTPAAAPRRDRQADCVASLAGLAGPTATGRCHYCGQPLNRRGYCEECV